MAGRMRTAEEEAWRRKTSDPVPVSLLSGDRTKNQPGKHDSEADSVVNYYEGVRIVVS